MGLVNVGMIRLPWLDRLPSRHPAMRKWAIVAGTHIVLVIGFMTLKGVLESPPHHGSEAVATQVGER